MNRLISPFMLVGLALLGGAEFAIAAGAPDHVDPVTNTFQSVPAGSSIPLIVRVRDVDGLPVPGVSVSFSAPGLTALGATVVSTSADGLAQATFLAPGTVLTGDVFYFATVAVAGITPVVFSIQVTSGTPIQPGTGGITIVSGNGQVAIRSSMPVKPLTVAVKDANGVALSGVQVNWEVVSGIGPQLSATSTFTDTAGMSSVTVRGSDLVPIGALVSSLTSLIDATALGSTVHFTFTTLGTGPSGQPVPFSAQVLQPNDRVITGRAGQTLPGGLQLLMLASYTPLANVGIELVMTPSAGPTPTATCANGVPLSDYRGLVTCDVTLGTKAGETQINILEGGLTNETIGLKVTAGPPSTIKIVSGDLQTGNIGQTLPLDLVALVTDVFNNPVPGAAVQWEVPTAGSVSLKAPTSSVTDASGRAFTKAALGRTAGDYSVRLRAGDASAEFRMTAEIPVGQVRIVAGQNQTALMDQAFAVPLAVQVLDNEGVPAVGAPVQFVLSSGSATLSLLTSVTDSEGKASTIVLAGSLAGPVTVTASAGTLAPVTFNLTVRQVGPVVSASGFLNGAGFQEGVVPGGIVTIVGAGLAPELDGCMSSNMFALGGMPTMLGNVSVHFGRFEAPIFSLCNTDGQEQVTVQAPFELGPGFTSVTIITGGGAIVVNDVIVLTVQPGIFQAAAQDGRLYGSVQRADGSLSGPNNPVQPREIVRLYATGLGPVLPRSATNQPGVRGQAVFLPVVVGVNNAGARVISAEYAENMIGVYVVTFEVPANTPTGSDLPLSLAVMTAMGDAPVYSNPSRIAVRAAAP